jgi:hypothetical protein
MIVLLCSAVTLVLAGDLVQGVLDFRVWDNFSRYVWAQALWDVGGGGGGHQFNIFVLPAVLVMATLLLCESQITSKIVRRLGRWLQVLVVVALVQTPLNVLGRVLYLSAIASLPAGLEPQPVSHPPYLYFLFALTVLRLIVCVAMLSGIRKFLVRRPDSALDEFVITQRRGVECLPQSTLQSRATLRAATLLALAAAAGIAIGVGTAIFDVRSSATAINWLNLRLGALDLGSTSLTDPSALSTPVLLLLLAIVVRRKRHFTGARNFARLVTGFAAFELLLTPTFIVANFQLNAGPDDVARVDVAAWSAARVLLCVSAVVCVLRQRTRKSVVPRENGPGHDDYAAVEGFVPSTEFVALEQSKPTSLPAPAQQRGRLALSQLLGVTATAMVATGVLVAAYNLIHPQGAIIGSWWSGPLGTDVLGGALREVALGQSGDFLFLFGPLLVILAIHLREPGSTDSLREKLVKQWLLSVAVAQWITTCLYAATADWGTGTDLISNIGWTVVRFLLCCAAVVYAIGLPPTTKRSDERSGPSSSSASEKAEGLERQLEPVNSKE